MNTVPKRLKSDLEEYGELDIYLDSGARAHVHKHDTEIDGRTVVIDSKAGDWRFSIDKIEHIEYPVSEIEEA